ncbi:MAG TPA: tetratricopeptide repeat protein [Gemmatimonadota bacterium]|nr:tetratricopeptide repeat protein [Gemmatimonadota bacterium]
MKSYQELFAELKRRKVFKVAAVYGGVAFVLLQVAELLGQGLRLPDSFMPFITAVVLLGFPLALILAWAFEVTPEGVHRTDRAAPGEIEGILAQPASKRWPHGLLALLGVAALLGGTWWAGRQSGVEAVGADGRPEALELAYATPDEDPRPSIAVLPFVNMSADEEQEYFSDGITEEILNTLANVDELRVSGRTSAFAYKGRAVDLRTIGEELGVHYLIEGSVRKAGDQLRITAQLIDATDGSHLWSDQYDRELKDVFAIQTEIAESIAGALTVPLGLEGDETLVTPTSDLTAYDLYLAGRTRMRERGLGLLEAKRMFEAAIARDSSWAPAWAALAETSEIRIWYSETFPDSIPDSASVQQALEEAERAARRALELDEQNASALVALGSVQRDRGQWDVAEATYRRALSLDPDNPEAHQQYGELLREVGRIGEAVRALDRAAALDPAPIRIDLLAGHLVLDDRLDEALEVYKVGLRRDPEVTLPRLWGNAGLARVMAGQEEAAVDAFQALERQIVRPDRMPDLVRRFVRGFIMADSSVIPAPIRSDLAPEMWMLMGYRDRAVATLRERSFLVHGIVPLPSDFWHPIFDPLRSDPEFAALVAASGAPRMVPERTPPSKRTRPLILQEDGEPGAKAQGAATS